MSGSWNFPKVRKPWHRSVWVLALLAVLLSYSYDFECLLETHGCQQQNVQVELDSSCAQPSVRPAVAALLPTHTSLSVPAPTTVAQPPLLWVIVDPPSHPPLSVPLGLRAPPVV